VLLGSPHFGPDGEGLVTFLVYPPDDLVLVVKTRHGHALIGRAAVTFCSWHLVVIVESIVGEQQLAEAQRARSGNSALSYRESGRDHIRVRIDT
jgi:hypothetical protein